MAQSGARPTDLPAVLPVFAVAGAVLLPGARLPLTVFEPRYLALVDDALAAGRLFALVQPKAGSDELYGVGTLARIASFAETGDGRYLINAIGLTRFRMAGEDEGRHGYRRVRADYRPYPADLLPGGDSGPVERGPLLASVSAYLARHGMAADLEKLTAAGDGDLVTALTMAAPLTPDEKQALLECSSMAERARLITAMFEIALASETGDIPIH